MLSYMLPVEEKSSPRTLNLNLNLNGSVNGNGNSSDDSTTKLLNSERSSVLKNSTATVTESQRPQYLVNVHQPIVDTKANDTPGTGGSILISNSTQDDNKKVKMSKIGITKNVTLKRVSFGSSKGSMVETLVFETPTPLPEHAEREFGSPPDPAGKSSTNTNSSTLDDSGIEMQEELERSKVRVSFYQSGKPHQISPTELQQIGFFETEQALLNDYSIGDNLLNDEMATATALAPNYDRQISTESGWDNPFRPGGDLSREADEIVNMIKGGKPITPTGDSQTFASGGVQLNGHTTDNGTSVVDGAIKAEISPLQSSQNGTKSPQTEKKNGGAAQPNTQISNQVVPGPQSASHVVIEDKKKKKCTCCVIQ